MAMFMEEIEDDMTGFVAPDGEQSDEQNAGSESEGGSQKDKDNKVKKQTRQGVKEDKVSSKWQDYLKSSEDASNPKHARLAKDRFRKSAKEGCT